MARITSHHRPRPRSLALLLLTIALCFAATCIAPVLVSDAQEQEIGLQLSQQIESSEDFELLGDAQIDAYINEIAGQIVVASPLQRPFEFTFKVSVNDDVNAFALPGGYCYVNTGLIEAAASESELVGVIAHEVSHVTCEHHRNMIANQFMIETAQGLVFNQESPAIAVAAAQVAAGLGMLRFSRSQESQADRIGVQAMCNAGWNPHGLRDFFESLREIQGRDPGRIEGFLSTHPATVTRIEEIDALIEMLPDSGNLRSDSPAFHIAQERVRDLLGR